MFFNYNNGLNMKIIRIVLLILIVYSFATMGKESWIILLLTLPGSVLAISFHEFAHAWMATKFGDTTPRSQGRLTLNPIKHIDSFGFFLMMFTHIGWGKPVEINPNNFTTNKSRGFCETMIALAGPLMNFILAFFTSLAIALLSIFKADFMATTVGDTLGIFLYIFVVLNIGLGVFNLLPLPPLDGEKIFRNIIPYKFKEWITTNYYTLYYIFMLLWLFGILSAIVEPVISVVYGGIQYVVYLILSIFI